MSARARARVASIYGGDSVDIRTMSGRYETLVSGTLRLNRGGNISRPTLRCRASRAESTERKFNKRLTALPRYKSALDAYHCAYWESGETTADLIEQVNVNGDRQTNRQTNGCTIGLYCLYARTNILFRLFIRSIEMSVRIRSGGEVRAALYIRLYLIIIIIIITGSRVDFNVVRNVLRYDPLQRVKDVYTIFLTCS